LTTAQNFILEERTSLIQTEVAKQIANLFEISVLRIGKVEIFASEFSSDQSEASVMVNILLLEKPPASRKFSTLISSLLNDTIP
jgi:hypothetical protein